MARQTASVGRDGGTCMSDSWVEKRAVAALGSEEERAQIQRHGHRGIITMDQESKMETVTTFRAAFPPPKSSGVRTQGTRSELLEKRLTQMISEKIQSERKQPTPSTDFCSTTQRDFCVKGFVSSAPETTPVHDYKTDQAITFWSEKYQQIQGVTGVRTLKAPFRKSATFSTPIREQLDEISI
ncbi:sperm-associated antigen 8 [Antennarius striatus]|uniref:sperm-associated antigen 8 n=1 Tax=Antennarius striatus TaxID=241820 RepID=UPI0035B3DB97